MCFSVLTWLRYSQAAPHRVEVCPLEGTLSNLLLVRLHHCRCFYVHYEFSVGAI